jgi:hypothetical protein
MIKGNLIERDSSQKFLLIRDKELQPPKRLPVKEKAGIVAGLSSKAPPVRLELTTL